jgi:hypothetical protein
MFQIQLEPTDAPEFVEAVRKYVTHALTTTKIESAFVVKIDNWFGPKWLKFSHKVAGTLGVASSDLVVPPFVPNRVVSEEYLLCTDEGSFLRADSPRPLHVKQPSGQNARRRISRLFPDTALFWWSGASQRNGRGCLKAYLPDGEGHVPWYVELSRDRGWTTSAWPGTDGNSEF